MKQASFGRDGHGGPGWRCWRVWQSWAAAFIAQARGESDDVLAVTRNFYGVLRVRRMRRSFEENGRKVEEPFRMLMHGGSGHGGEYESPKLRRTTVDCYSPNTAVAQVLRQRAHRRPQRVGLIGLGVGMLTAFAEPGDEYRLYEIDPMMVRYAREYFHFLEDCRGHYEILVGDGRLTLERERPQNFDVIVLDAFSSDAMPTHLLTVEAFAIYLRHLAPDGVIAVHVANRHYDLDPVVAADADAHQLQSVTIDSFAPSLQDFGSEWMLVARDLTPWNIEQIRAAAIQLRKGRARFVTPVKQRRVLWTDDHSSLFEVL